MQMSVNFASHWASTAEASDVVICAFVLDMSRADSEGVGILTRLFLSEKMLCGGRLPSVATSLYTGEASQVLR